MRLGKRLGEHPHDVLNHVLAKHPKGHAIEFGVGRGTTLRLIADVMPVTAFDSFDGLPEDWRPGFGKGRFKCPPPDVPGAELIIGLFENTLPGFEWPDRIGLVHFDADLYSSTKTALQYVGPHLAKGTFVVFDEFHGYDGFEDHEAKAWTEYVEQTGIEFAVVGHGPEQLCLRIK